MSSSSSVSEKRGLSSVSKASLAALWCVGCAGAAAVAAVLNGQYVVAVLATLACAGAACGWAWLRRASRSIRKAIVALSAAADGQLRVRVLGIRGHGDVSLMLVNINRLLDQFEAFGKEADEAMLAAAEKRFYRKILLKGLRGDFAAYAKGINATLDKMASNSDHLGMFTERMLKDAVEVSMTVNEGNIANVHIVRGIHHARDESQGIAAATEEMVAGIQTISSDAKQAAELSSQAQQVTEQGREVMQSAKRQFEGMGNAFEQAAARAAQLAKASESIGGILSSIETIAGQTNLLALNATIEAARAGEAGKGFAVVAGEVKSLSNQTAKSTEEIGHLVANLRQEMAAIIDAMRSGTNALTEGRQAMEAMDGRMGEISRLVGETSGRMQDVSHILTEQAKAANQISGGIQKVAAHSDANASAIEKSTGSLSAVETEMGSLLKLLAEWDIPNKILLIAKSDHIAWKKRLFDMLTGRVKLDPDELSSDKTCRLGKWYHGPDAAKHHDQAAFKELAIHHRAVHENGVAATRAYNSGNVDEAIRLVDEVEKASAQVLRCLDELIVATTAKAA